jgi:broad specificity phosphatase PhoE
MIKPIADSGRQTSNRPHTFGLSHHLQLVPILILGFGLGPASPAGLKVYFLRHAEAGHNAVKQWENKPRNQWPAYVGDPNSFTPLGKSQILPCTEKLKKLHFDLIAVSPTWRTRNTVTPYLRQTGQTAEIWPALLEFGSIDQQHDFAPLPPPSTNLFTGEIIRLPESDADLFTLRQDSQRLFRLGHSPAQKAADRWAAVQKDIDLIQKRFGGSEKSILLVGHDNIGRLLLEAITQDKNLFDVSLLNTSLWMVEQQLDGRFQLRLLNDKPVH